MGIDAYLGFAVRADKVTFGLECLLRLKKAPVVVLYDSSLGSSAKRKAEYYCEKRGSAFLPVAEGYLSSTLKRNNVKIVAVSDQSLGGQIIRILASEQPDALRR